MTIASPSLINEIDSYLYFVRFVFRPENIPLFLSPLNFSLKYERETEILSNR